MSSDVALPDPAEMTPERTWAFYLNIPGELEAGFLSTEETGYLAAYYSEAGLLRAYRRGFFRHHFCMTFHQAASFLLAGREAPTILDLGCGSGTQSLFFALMGARVVAVDMDETSLSILRKRKAFYRDQAGRELRLEVHRANTFEFDYGSAAPIGGVYSMFAFNMMQPSGELMDAITPHLADDARLAVLDGNNSSWLPRLYPPRRRAVWSPAEFRAELERRGFVVVSHRGGVALPPPLWACGPMGLITGLDGLLGRSWLLAISHQIMAERRQERRQGEAHR